MSTSALKSEAGAQIAGRNSDEIFNRADMETQQATELPDRQAMSLINADVAAPINAALALNVLSDGSIANAVATQTAPITQTT
jgi:hypothetical protein